MVVAMVVVAAVVVVADPLPLHPAEVTTITTFSHK
jgi:hypothetical protein